MAVGMVKVTGVSNVVRNLRAAQVLTEAQIERGLKRAGLFVQRESQLIVPILTGNLKGGANTRNVGGRGSKADIVIAYHADYAVFVHENLDARHLPGKTAKFLERPLREKRNQIFNIIRRGF